MQLPNDLKAAGVSKRNYAAFMCLYEFKFNISIILSIIIYNCKSNRYRTLLTIVVHIWSFEPNRNFHFICPHY